MSDAAGRLIEVRNLSKRYPVRRGVFRRVDSYVDAVRSVDLAIHRGEAVALVGESGCGKTTLGRCIVLAVRPSSGSVVLHQEEAAIDLTTLEPARLRSIRPQIQVVFQDPYRSLNPRMRVGETVGEPLLAGRLMPKSEVRARVSELLTQVGLSPEYADRYPHAFSGGQRQRIGIARALATRPSLLICDEPVSGLDVSVQARILNLFQDLREAMGLSYLFVSHDLAVVRTVSDRILVMYAGRIVEESPTDALYDRPFHPYTAALLASALSLVPGDLRSRPELAVRYAAGIPDTGCAFAPRCPFATDRCRTQLPQMRSAGSRRAVACHHFEEIDLRTRATSEASRQS